MVQSQIEDRLSALEREVSDLKRQLSNGAKPKDWRSTVGMFTGDEIMKRIDEHARRYREADRRKARQKHKRPPRAKK